MQPIIQLDKTQPIIQFFLYVMVIPLVIGIAVGIITGKLKPNSLKLTLSVTVIISLAFFIVVLLTLQSQGIPLLAVMLAIVSIIVMNISAVISNKIVSEH